MKNKPSIFKAVLCFLLALAAVFALTGCKDKVEKQTAKLSGKFLSDRQVQEKFKSPEGKVAFKTDYTLPVLDEKNNHGYSEFNKIMESIESNSQSTAKTVIANKLFEKGKPWKETGGYTVPYASYHYISVVVDIQREASSGNISEVFTPVTFSLLDGRQSSLAHFGKVSSDYLKTQLAKAIMVKISDSGAGMPELSAVRSAFELTDFALTPTGFDIYFTNSTLSGYSGVADFYSFTFDEVENLLNLPNLPED